MVTAIEPGPLSIGMASGENEMSGLVRAMQELKELGVWMTGLDMRPQAKPYTALDFTGRTGLVVGSEGRGLSRLVSETCDFIACLPMKGSVASLNAGVAGAVALYEIVRQRAR